MKPQPVSLDTIEDFLAQHRIAIVGISHDPHNFSVSLFNELCRRGYDMVPVNPQLQEVSNRRCYAHLQEIDPPVEAALLMTSPAVTEAVVNDCAQAGIRRIWMYRAGGNGAVSQHAVQFCLEHGIQVIPGQCPYMFLPGAGGVHRLHQFIRIVTGRFPQRHTRMA